MRNTFKRGDRVRLTKDMRKTQRGGPFYRQCAGKGTVRGLVPGADHKEYVVVRFPKGTVGFLPEELKPT